MAACRHEMQFRGAPQQRQRQQCRHQLVAVMVVDAQHLQALHPSCHGLCCDSLAVVAFAALAAATALR